MKATRLRLQVNKCGNCPFFGFGNETGETRCSVNARIWTSHKPGAPAPNWCPMRSASIVVDLKDGV